jgi:pyridinium-3,5-bisthiocarboxylic acid mononucleotide nickel chelatase
MQTLYFDVFSGASGDMILSSLIDLGVPVGHLRQELSRLPIPGFSINVEKVKRSGIVCLRLLLDWTGREAQLDYHARDNYTRHDHGRKETLDRDLDEHPHAQRGNARSRHDHEEDAGYLNPRQILDIIKKTAFPDTVFTRCEKILMRIATAEAAVHGVPVEEVHFHEIGAVDTIIDVAGISLCLDYLNADRIFFSTLTDGRGSVRTRHGVMPVPVPAVTKLAEGFSLKRLDIETELLTPTGCGALTALGTQSDVGLNGRILKSGYGCGEKVFDAGPNALRVFLIDSTPSARLKNRKNGYPISQPNGR